MDRGEQILDGRNAGRDAARIANRGEAIRELRLVLGEALEASVIELDDRATLVGEGLAQLLTNPPQLVEHVVAHDFVAPSRMTSSSTMRDASVSRSTL